MDQTPQAASRTSSVARPAGADVTIPRWCITKKGASIERVTIEEAWVQFLGKPASSRIHRTGWTRGCRCTARITRPEEFSCIPFIAAVRDAHSEMNPEAADLLTVKTFDYLRATDVPDAVQLGAVARNADVAEHPLIKPRYRLLRDARHPWSERSMHCDPSQ